MLLVTKGKQKDVKWKGISKIIKLLTIVEDGYLTVENPSFI
jgi:hypothetical protein